jgi:CelD/BcsL family acetyltransferase involved in cellulose biosynthesis
MKITIVHPADLGDTELRTWRALQQSDPALVNPFLAPEFTRGVARCRPDVRVAVVEDGPDVLAFFPYERSALGVGHPVGFGLTDLQGLIGRPELRLDARALLKACRLNVWAFDHLLAHQATFQPYQTVVRAEPIIDLTSGFEAYSADVHGEGAKRLKEVRYKERKLARDVGKLRYVFASADPAALCLLMRWKSDQYRRTGRMDRFARPWIVRLAEHFHRTGFGLLSILYAGEQPVAANFDLRYRTTVAGWFTAYDPRFARYSPGMIGNLRLAQACAQHGVTEIAMGRGGKQFKERLKSREIRIAEGRVARASAGAALHWLHTTPLNSARNAALGDPRIYDRADRMLKTYARLRGRAR